MGASFTSEAAARAGAAATPRHAPRRGSTIGRAFEIFFRVSAYLAGLMAWRLSLGRRPAPPGGFADFLQDPRPSFVKLGPHLGPRPDLFPPGDPGQPPKPRADGQPLPAEGPIAPS